MTDPLLTASMQVIVREDWLKKTVEPILEPGCRSSIRTTICGRTTTRSTSCPIC